MDRQTPTPGSRNPFAVALMWALIPSLAAFLIGSTLGPELQKVIYTGAATLLFGGLLGGVLKLQLDEVVAAKRRREDAAGFVSNVLADLKSVYDRVARSQTLIPAHKSVKTYGDEMRDLIEARVKLRNVIRALDKRAAGVDETVRGEVKRRVNQMGDYLDTLLAEFRDNYKSLSDKQRGYEERANVLVKRYAEGQNESDPPELPNFVWNSLAGLPHLKDFIGEGKDYESHFENPLDDASQFLRIEHARILDAKGGMLISGL